MIDPSTDMRALQRRLFAGTRLARGPLLALITLTLIGACVAVAQMVAASHAMAAVHPGTAAATSSTSPLDAAWVRPLALLLGLVLLRAALAGAAERCAQRIATRVKSDLRTRAIAATLARGPRALAREQTGELVTTVMDGVEKLDAWYRRFVPQVIATAVIPPIIVLAVAWLDPTSALILAITGPLIPIFMWLLGTLAAQRTRAQWQALTALGGSFLDVLQGLPTLTLSGRGRHAADRLDRASERLRVTTMDVLKVAFLSGFVLEIAATLGTALVAVGVGVRMLEGWIAFQPGLAVLLLAPEFYLPFRQLGQRHHAGMEGVAAAERIFALIDADAPPADRAGTDVARARMARAHAADQAGSGAFPHCPLFTASETRGGRGEWGFSLHFALSLRNVTFVYPGAAAPVLHDVSVTFPARSFTAIVGASGSGKSTLAALLLRLLEPSRGALFLDDRPAHAFTADAWRGLVTMAPQKPHFFAGTILDNLRLGHPAATRDEVRAAARMAEADAFIAALPHGYDTAIDEAAARLSGGERQRLAIARALVKPAPVLLLDEPGSSLDPVSEAAIARVLTRIASERTVIVIAHRHATIQRADRVVRLDGRGGLTVEIGRALDSALAGVAGGIVETSLADAVDLPVDPRVSVASADARVPASLPNALRATPAASVPPAFAAASSQAGVSSGSRGTTARDAASTNVAQGDAA